MEFMASFLHLSIQTIESLSLINPSVCQLCFSIAWLEGKKKVYNVKSYKMQSYTQDRSLFLFPNLKEILQCFLTQQSLVFSKKVISNLILCKSLTVLPPQLSAYHFVYSVQKQQEPNNESFNNLALSKQKKKSAIISILFSFSSVRRGVISLCLSLAILYHLSHFPQISDLSCHSPNSATIP